MPHNPERQTRFLAALRLTWSVKDAARAIGVRRETPYRWRARDKAFAEAWDEVLERGTAALEGQALQPDPQGRQGLVSQDGTEGEVMGRPNDRLLMCLLKAHRPERFKKREGLEHPKERGDTGTREAIDGRPSGHLSGD